MSFSSLYVVFRLLLRLLFRMQQCSRSHSYKTKTKLSSKTHFFLLVATTKRVQPLFEVQGFVHICNVVMFVDHLSSQNPESFVVQYSVQVIKKNSHGNRSPICPPNLGHTHTHNNPTKMAHFFHNSNFFIYIYIHLREPKILK